MKLAFLKRGGLALLAIAAMALFSAPPGTASAETQVAVAQTIATDTSQSIDIATVPSEAASAETTAYGPTIPNGDGKSIDEATCEIATTTPTGKTAKKEGSIVTVGIVGSNQTLDKKAVGHTNDKLAA